MKQIAWKVDDDGMLLGARVHDAVLISLEFANRSHLNLTFRRIDGTGVRLSHEGAQEVCLGQIWDSSIVSDNYMVDSLKDLSRNIDRLAEVSGERAALSDKILRINTEIATLERRY